MIASAAALLTYLADLVEEIERLAVTVLPPNDADDIELGREEDGALVVDLECRPPMARRSAEVEIEIFERWRPTGPDRYERVDYKFELRHHELGYRRAFHRHDAEHFVRSFDVATHEHCETTIGSATCDHSSGVPVADATDGFLRLYELWLTNEKPDCSAHQPRIATKDLGRPKKRSTHTSASGKRRRISSLPRSSTSRTNSAARSRSLLNR